MVPLILLTTSKQMVNRTIKKNMFFFFFLCTKRVAQLIPRKRMFLAQICWCLQARGGVFNENISLPKPSVGSDPSKESNETTSNGSSKFLDLMFIILSFKVGVMTRLISTLSSRKGWIVADPRITLPLTEPHSSALHLHLRVWWWEFITYRNAPLIYELVELASISLHNTAALNV